MDVHRLIREIRSRPALWDMRSGDNKSRHSAPNLWKEVAETLGVNVEQCKRKWKNLRDAYRAEVRRAERRMERDKLIGQFDPNTNYNSKWVYFEPMNFINDIKRPRYTLDHENTSSNDEVYDQQFHSSDGIKIEHARIHNEDDQAVDPGDEDNDEDLADDEAANDMLFEEFQSIATPQAARRLSSTISMTNSLEQTLSNELPETTTPADNGTTAYNKDCKCSNRMEERVHFLEDLEKEEQKLMQSTKQDIKRALDHVGDSDYNFLVSFLPQMKKMNDLQNLQFRARMCDLVLNILAPTMSTHNSPVPPPLTPAPIMAQVECRENPAITLAQPECSENLTDGCGANQENGRNFENPISNAATRTSCNMPPGFKFGILRNEL